MDYDDSRDEKDLQSEIKVMDKLVSVIVPVYNVKEYLEKCINSICTQIYRNLEIIIIDDGSTDGSSEICDQLQLKDERIIIIHKENGGVVSARKAGLERAHGEYTIVIDSDDWVESRMILELCESADENCADIVTSGYYREYDNEPVKVVDGVKEGIYYHTDDMEYLYRNMIFTNSSEQWGIIPSLWCKLIKTSIMKELHLNLNEMIHYGEDAAVTYGCCVRAKKIVVTHHAYYHYILRLGSAVSSHNPYYFRNINEVYLFLKKEFDKNSYKSVLLRQLDVYMTKIVFHGLSYLFGLDRDVAIPYYDFDKGIITKNARVVLYGAGRVGQAYYKQICADKLYQLAGWVDKNYLYYQEQGMKVSAVETIAQLEYDYVILAFKQENTAKSIKKGLIEKYRLEPEKLIWLKPVSIIDKYQIEEY